MSYLNNAPKLYSVTIDGTDYTSNFVSFQCADASANRNGLLSTTGTLVLGYTPNGLDISTYNRKKFKRGSVVIVDILYPPSTVVRHPRGYLYVISTSYNPDNDTLNIELGCYLVLAQLLDDVSNILEFPEIFLEEEQQTYGNISSALAITGHIVYQDNTGQLVKERYFPFGINNGVLPNSKWTSILGVNVLNVAPLTGAGALPDSIEIAFQRPPSEDEAIGEVITDTTISKYPILFPLKTLVRKTPTNGIPGISGSLVSFSAGPVSSDCGNGPDYPTDDPVAGRANDLESCSENFTVVETVRYLSATKETTQTTYNYGIGGQTSKIEQLIYGPAIEVNSQYYTDKYAYCVQSFGSFCIPNGGCFPEGNTKCLHEKSIQENTYDRDGALIKTVTSNYKNVGYAAQTTDWRSTYVDTFTGLERENWRNTVQLEIEASVMYLDQLTIVDNIYQSDSGSKQITTTYTSTSDSGGSYSNRIDLDARRGIKTVETRISKTVSSNPLLPDRTNNADSIAKNQIDEISSFSVFTDTYKTPPTAGPYIVYESLPIELKDYTAEEYLKAVEKYGKYLVLWAKAEALGLSLSFNLNTNITTNWYPGQPFRYKDVDSGELLILISDACAWAIESDGAVVTLKGGWLGNSNGTVTIPNNLVGNSLPAIPADPVYSTYTPPSATNTIVVTDETSISSGSLEFTITIDNFIKPQVTLGGLGNNGILQKWPKIVGENIINIQNTSQCYVSGLIVGPGSLLNISSMGSLPLSNGYTLLSSSPTIIDPNIFST